MFGKKKNPAIRSLIAEGTEVEGNTHFADGMQIDGKVRGDLTANEGGPSILVISESAHVTGQLQADKVIINGYVNGPVRARDMLELLPKARIEGDVYYKALEMHPGATISGQMHPTFAAIVVGED